MTRPARRDPLEERSLAPLILGLTLLLLACLAWAVRDETVTRRPWKAYQREYVRRALALVEKEIAREKERIRIFLESPKGKELLAARRKARAAAAPSTPLGRRIQTLEKDLDRVRREIRDLRARSRKANGKKLLLLSRGAAPADRPVQAVTTELDRLEKALLRAGDREEEILARLDRLKAPLRKARAPLARLRLRLRGLEKTRAALAAFTPRVEQILVAPEGRVERCISCHLAMKEGMPGLPDPPFRKHPGDYLVHHPPEKFGCVACHEGYGTALDDLAAPHGFDPSYPRQVLRGPAAQGRCAACHGLRDGRDRTLLRGELPGAPVLSAGMKAFERNLCQGCHVTPGFPARSHPAPPLDQAPAKLGFRNVLEWIRDPIRVRKDARMPTFHLDPQGKDAFALASYIFSLPRGRLPAVSWPAWLDKKEDDMTDPELDRLDALLERGRKTWSRVQCADCHPREGKGGDAGVYAPDLSTAGARLSRDWIYRHLQDPRSLYPESRMPRIELSDGEIRGLVESILRDPEFGGGEEDDEEESSPGRKKAAPNLPSAPSRDPAVLERGARLVLKLGCAGCHSIPGHEKDPPAGSDLSDYGDKKIDDLDFGFLRDLPRTVEAWTLRKLIEPRAFGEELFMPRPHLGPAEARAVTAFLLGLTRRPVPRDLLPPRPLPFPLGGAALRIFRDRQCLTCHSLGRRGGDYAPELSFEGSRVRPAWLEKFLAEPFSIRPRLVQMPQLQLPPREVKTLAAFFRYACRREDLESLPPSPGVPPPPKGGAALLREKGCLACHTWKNEGGILGADIEKAPERLRPGFVYHWLLDPRRADKDSPCPRSDLTPAEVSALARFLAGGETR